jgi:glutamyl-tRNA synthetase
MSPPVITRFAPSPTGFLHIGGARTALFNWAYARRHGGRMLLRIEDTDRQRSTEPAIAAILDGLRWLGIDWHGEPLSQFAGAARHREVAEELLRRGRAYRCYCTAAELEEMRERAVAAGLPQRYDGRWRDRPESDAPPGIKPAIRFKAPSEGETVVEDQVLGRVVFHNRELDDLIILRSDGTPTYNLAVVVDDHDMVVTHIIRGVDHLTNAARQSQIYQALDWRVPVMAHLPLIHGPDGAKLSKRHGALGVDAYRDMGYLPAAMRNYLARLGWSHGDDEIFSTEQLVAWFDLEHVGKSPARFDFAKLESLNGLYMRSTPDAALLAAFLAFLADAPGGAAMLGKLDGEARERLRLALPGLKERARTLAELADQAGFLVAERPLALDDKARAILDGDGRQALSALLPVLEQSAWSAAALEAAVKSFAEAQGSKLGKLAQPLRAALTGSATSPGIFDVLVALGRAEALSRIRDQVGSRQQ